MGIKSENVCINGWMFIDIEGVDVGIYVESVKEYLVKNFILLVGYLIIWVG